MTSVYGVTFRGACDQIFHRLDDIAVAGGFGPPEDVRAHELRSMATWLASLTLSSLGEVFTGASDAMKWLALCASEISSVAGEPVEWDTPLGLPVLQPYFKLKARRVHTVLTSMTIYDEDINIWDDLMKSNLHAPVNRAKQRAGMPPNYVHSLDSSHMMMTAARCFDEEVLFASVHDSFWTHACDVPTLNWALREAFIELHQQPLLSHLHAQFQRRYPQIDWSKLPPPVQGDLDVRCVRDATYFFS